MKIHVKESTIIRPAKETPKHNLWLSNLDLLQVRLHMGTLYFYKPPNGSSHFFEIRVLKEALSKVLVPFYPAAGRLGRDRNGRLEIQCNGEGVLFVVAETDSTISDIGDLMQSLDLSRFIPGVDYSGDISAYPLILIQVTFFRCEGVCVGYGIHHTLGDGASLLNFVKAYCRTARGLPITVKPFIDRSILRARDPPSPTFHHTEYEPCPFWNRSSQNSNYKSLPEADSAIATLKITADEIRTLKAKATNIDESMGRYSTYEVLTAHIWRCACKARKDLDLNDDQAATRLHIILDGRTRLRPRLPQGYFGNVLFHARPVALFSDLLREPFKDTVERIHGEISKMTEEYLRSAIDYLERHPKIDDLVPGEGNQIFQCTNFCIVGTAKWPLYGMDFGWGTPYCVRHATINEGKGFISSSPDNDRSLILAMCLNGNHLQQFKKLFYDFLLVAAM